MKKVICFMMGLLGVATTTHAGWTLIDDFDGYDNSTDTHTTVASAGSWTSVFDGTDNSHILDSDKGQSLQTIGGAAWRGAEKDLTGTGAEMLVGETNTYFWQVKASYTSDPSGWDYDFLMGLSPSVAMIDDIDAWQDFNVMPYINNEAVSPYINASGPGTYWAPMNPDAWYNVWVVVYNDATAPTYDLYYSTENGAPTLVVAGAYWRVEQSGMEVGQDLNAIGFMAAGHVGTDLLIDNIYYAPGEDTSNPLATELLDDFSGDLSAYTNTRILDSDGGTHNTYSWQISGGALELNTGTAVSGAEQYALIRNGLSLGVNEEVSADFSVSGSQDLGLYVGGTPPSTDVREDYVVVYARGDGNVYSRGFDGTTDYGLAGAGVVAYDKLFIKRTATNTYEAGYYDGNTRVVIATRTPSTPNSGDVVGFYADVRAVGILGSVDNLALIPSDDTDGDGLPDQWEQQIVDADAGDAITTIEDVLPGDDFDNDGYANADEYALGLDPTAWNDSSLDADGDYLPDNWEIEALGRVSTYNSYDDPDSDGYNNQAERIAGTDPLLDTDHPDFSSPSVAFMRDTIVTNNALLMGGGSYGHAINGISFQDQIIYTFDGYQYTAYYDTVGSEQRVCLARRKVDDTAVGAWDIVRTDSAFLNGDESAWDAHDVIAFGICPQDGTLHVAWDHHNNTLRYRRSIVGLCTTNKDAWGAAGMLGAEQNWLVNASTPEYDVTYPQFVATPSGGLVLDRRIGISGNGDQLFQVYDPGTGAWAPSVEFISRDGTYVGPNPWGSTVTGSERCAYINGLDFDTHGAMHVTWTWREDASQFGNRDICYAWSPDMGTNWYNSASNLVADTSIGQHITMDSPGIAVVPLNMRQLMINQQAQCVDNDGRVHVLMIHRRQDPGYEPSVFSALFSTRFTAYYHYFRDPDTGVWTQRRIPPDGVPGYGAGSRPCIGYDAQGNIYAAYTAYPAGTDVFPGYLDAGGKLVIASASKASDYTDWAVKQVVDVNFDGEALLDQARLLNDNILTIYIQEHVAYSAGDGIPAPLHTYDYAVDIPEPATANKIACTFMGNDVLISTLGQTGTNYQLHVSTDLKDVAGWNAVGPSVGGSDSLIAFPVADGLTNSQSFYKVGRTPAP